MKKCEAGLKGWCKMRLIDAEEIEELFYKQVEYGATDLVAAFDDALQDARTVDAAELLRDQWISVDDRLPEAAETVNKDSQDEFSLSNSVLIFGNNGFAIAMVERDEYHEIFVDMDGNYISEVTKWMPLPEPPEVDKT